MSSRLENRRLVLRFQRGAIDFTFFKASRVQPKLLFIR
jgi:hypothetical protein